jgi:hypothetical protein
MADKKIEIVKMNGGSKDEHREYKIVPYSVTRTVMEVDEVAHLTEYDRHKDTGNFLKHLKI